MVSVIIPTYNRPTIVPDTIQSILNQTYSDLEIIVVSDGHQDDVRQAMGKFKDSRFKYYEIEHSGRPAVPRNFGISKAKGAYIAFCDDDDIWMPEKLQLQMEEMKDDKKIGLVYTKVLLEKGKKKRIVPDNGKQGFIFKELFLSYNFIANSTVLIKRATIDTVGFFDEDILFKATEDFDLWLRISKEYKVGFIAQPLVIHRESGNSISKGPLVQLKKYYLVTSKLYRKKDVGLGLFIKGLLLLVCKTLFEMRHQRWF